MCLAQVYNLLRDHGQKGRSRVSGVDIALGLRQIMASRCTG